MEAEIAIFWGQRPEVGSEIQFLDQLKADLIHRKVSAVVLANFFTDSGSRQVDFLVVTEDHVCHVELKNYNDILIGGKNGPWSARARDSSLQIIDRQNPYVQALGCKTSISDDMHALADQYGEIPKPPPGKKFYTQFDSVVCVFPNLAAESQVPSDYKVRTLGYADFLHLLLAPGPQPGWSRSNWMGLVRQLALTDATSSAGTKLEKNTAQVVVDQYSNRLRSFYSEELHELVPLPLLSSDGELSFSDVPEALDAEMHLEILGPSGSGKSHLARHLAIALTNEGWVCLLVEAGMYEGKLSRLLDRSVARFTEQNAQVVLQSAAINGQRTVVIVDGYTECPQSLRERLVGDISAICLRMPVATLITSQTPVSPAVQPTKAIVVGKLGSDHREALLRSYGAPEILPWCTPFSTAYELSVAAECFSELQGAATRANLFAAFLRKRLSFASSPALTRDTLRHLATTMDERLVTFLPLEETWRVAEQYLNDASAPLVVMDDLLDCSIVRTDQGRFAFTHELLGRFLTIEGLFLKHRPPAMLVSELKRPRHEDLAQLAIEFEQDPSRLEQLFRGMSSSDLFTIALLGRAGPVAARVSRSTARELIRAITASLGETLFEIHSQTEGAILNGYELSEADRALLAAVGTTLWRGDVFPEVTALLDATDLALRRSDEVQSRVSRRRLNPSVIVAVTLTGVSNIRSEVPASILLGTCEYAHINLEFRRDGSNIFPSIEGLGELVRGVESTRYSRLLLACYMLEAMASIDAAVFLPHVLRLCWESQAYHVQLTGLRTAQAFASTVRGHALHEEVSDFLLACETENIFLSTQLVDASFSYGLIEPPDHVDRVSEQIGNILAGPPTDEMNQLAYRIVSSQFEDVIAPPYIASIEALSSQEEISLYVAAALGGKTDTFWVDWLLCRLIERGDDIALPAFEYWATHLDADNPFVQSVASCFMLAIEGCARFLDSPPELVNCETADCEAWKCYGAIIFWMSRSDLNERVVNERCLEHWQRLTGDLLLAAVDPLYWFDHPGLGGSYERRTVTNRLAEKFPEEMRSILERSLGCAHSLTTIFRHPTSDLMQKVVSLLGVVGNLHTVELLHPYVDDPILGRYAIASIRKLSKGER